MSWGNPADTETRVNLCESTCNYVLDLNNVHLNTISWGNPTDGNRGVTLRIQFIQMI